MEYSQIILNFMENRGVTGYRIAKDTGISESLFGKWRVHPTSKIDAITVTKIADYFDVTVDQLLGKEQKNKPSDSTESLTQDDIKFLDKLKQLRQDDRDFLAAQIDLLLARQQEKK